MLTHRQGSRRRQRLPFSVCRSPLQLGGPSASVRAVPAAPPVSPWWPGTVLESTQKKISINQPTGGFGAKEGPSVLSVHYSDVFIQYYIGTDVEVWPGV